MSIREEQIFQFKAKFSEWQELHSRELPSFSLIFRGEKILSMSHNEVESQKDGTLHSELIAIQNACKILNNRYLSDCTLITTLEPCLQCTGAILLSRISEVIYFSSQNKIPGISHLSPEMIYSSNHFPYLFFQEDREISQTISEYFKNLRS